MLRIDYINTCAVMLLLLGDDAKKAKQVIAEYKPQFESKEKFLSYVDSLNTSGDRIEYVDQTTVHVNIQ